MNSTFIAVLVFACVFAGGVTGLALHRRLPEHHRDADSRDVVKLVMGLIATIAALVLSLLIASAHAAYDTQESEVQMLGAHIVQLNRILVHYGPETGEIRVHLRHLVEAELGHIWHKDGGPTASALPPQRSEAEVLYDKLSTLEPKNEAQKYAQGRALTLVTTMSDTRQLLYEQAGGSLSWPFFAVMVFWLVVLFVGFGLYGKRNATVLAAFFVGALTVAGAIFLILEMNHPYSGVMQISSAPISNALIQISR
ncbi:MAG TPA: hypothetical protein VIK97_18510 [Casimicrobiaceae bacterium]